MKRLILTMVIIVIFTFQIYPSVGFSYYYIHLKNGRGFQTYQYWEEGEQVRFYIYDGVAGVGKEEIDRIERREKETDDYMGTTLENIGKKELPPSSSVTGKGPEPGKSTVGFEPKPSMSNAPKINKKEDTKKDPDIMREFNKLEKKFESRKSMTIDELKNLKNDLIALRGKIVSSHLEADFHEEDAKIADMKFFINDLLIIKSRSH